MMKTSSLTYLKTVMQITTTTVWTLIENLETVRANDLGPNTKGKEPRLDSSRQRNPIGPQSGQKAPGSNHLKQSNKFDDFSENNFENESEGMGSAMDASNKNGKTNKQIPLPRAQNGSSSNKRPDFNSLKNAKPSGLKEPGHKMDSKASGLLKPNMSLDPKSFNKRPQFSDFRVSGGHGGLSRPHMLVRTGNATSKNMKELSLGKSIWDPYDKKPRHEQILDQCYLYIEGDPRLTLEELFEHNNRGTLLLKEINELLTTIIDKHKASLVDGKSMPSLQQSRSGGDPDKQQKIFEKEMRSGQHLLHNLQAELDEVDRIIESVRDPM